MAPAPSTTPRPGCTCLAARVSVAALARAGWLHDPAEVAALRYRVQEKTAVIRAQETTIEELHDEFERLRVLPTTGAEPAPGAQDEDGT